MSRWALAFAFLSFFVLGLVAGLFSPMAMPVTPATCEMVPAPEGAPRIPEDTWVRVHVVYKQRFGRIYLERCEVSYAVPSESGFNFSYGEGER